MRLFLKIVLGLVALGLLAYGVVMFVTSDDRTTARDFITDLSTGAYAEARSAMHEDLARQFTAAQLAEALQGVRPYTEISFSTVEKTGGIASLSGTASTADGCSSKIEIELVKGTITSFNIQPLCRD